MSAPEAKLSYDMQVTMGKRQHLYQLFLDWALTAKVDGIVVGATFPEIIRYCSKKAGKSLGIFSPGVGTQGGSASEVISSGTNYLIVAERYCTPKTRQVQPENCSYRVLPSSACAFLRILFALSNVVLSIAVS